MMGPSSSLMPMCITVTPVNCGNYILHDLAMAKWEAKAFLKRPWKFTYPKARRIKVGGKTFFDA